MILSGETILEEIGKNIFIDPFDISQVNTNSYNLKLYPELQVYSEPLDMKTENRTRTIIIPEDGYEIKPGVLYLARTCEYTKTYNYVPILEGRSSVARLGISVHSTAGFGDIGFEGYWTLQITCVEPVRIYPNVKICQIVYHEAKGAYSPYNNKYQKSGDIQKSRLYKEL